MLSSTIWFKDISAKQDDEKKDETDEVKNDDAAAADKDDEKQRPSLLYYELLKLVQAQSDDELKALEKNLDVLKRQNVNDWHQLIEWDIPDQYEVVRQDLMPNGIKAKYSDKQLYEQGSSSATFHANRFYDYNEYLPQLVLLAHIVDDEFQKSVQNIFSIDKKTNTANLNARDPDDDEKKAPGVDGVVTYSRGPVKLIERAQAKSENDYVNEAFPTSACVLDFNRCTLVFNDISTMLKALKLFVDKIKYYQSGSIIGIVRDKNGFEEYVKQPQYADIKLNVLIRGTTNNIIGEVQFLLKTMKRYKDKAHNLYSVQRQQEYFDNSVTKILPKLLDEDKQLFVAGNMGDEKAILKLLVLNNKSEQDIVKIDEESGESILQNACYLGHDKLLRFIGSFVPEKLFIDRLFDASQHDLNAIEAGIMGRSVLSLRYLLSIDAVKERCINDKDALFRIVYWLYRAYDKSMSLYVIGTLGLDEVKLRELQKHKCAKPEEGKFSEFAKRYWEESISDEMIQRLCVKTD
eukprot:CAMPEP_0197075890 /NCGR_PEP_ID=MMETSP1384-20130603/211839_1 /TAXON_ID=29189 /ORGANISM="Ammonia sp." /LENGTH=518 /DNA_ID=CAMNT_0042514739 /DNA_START=1 /DNA_END=1557 /DNA_ORIENTATION=+